MRRIKSQIYQEIDTLHHEAMPQAKFSVNKLLFEEVRYKHQYTQSFECKNTGKSGFSFEIMTDN